MKRWVISIIMTCCLLTAQAQVREEGNYLFVMIDSVRKLELCIARDPLGTEAGVGISQYHHPAVPVTTTGRIVIPSSVVDCRGKRYDVRGVTRAGLQGCAELTEVVLPDSCEGFGDQAFQGCAKLESITFPPTMKVIYAKAMSGCSSLRRVTVLGATPPWCDENVFDEQTYQKATLVVPAGSEDAYRRAPAWRRFKFRMTKYE